MKPYYITTAIDYTNAPPHIGHAYEKVLADVMARFQRLNGREVYFLTGVDQHGQKVQKSADKAGQSPQEFVDGITQHFTALWDKLNVRYDGWAATTDIKHKRVVQAMLQKLHDCGQLYKKSMLSGSKIISAAIPISSIHRTAPTTCSTPSMATHRTSVSRARWSA
jgi:methionyl-tRNA synthetase